MKRLDWSIRLAETIEAHRRLPFRWAGRGDSHDCCTFVAACADAIAGSRRVDELLTHYQDEPSARAYIAESGGLVAAIGRYFGKPKDLSALRTGDVVVWRARRFEYAGIVDGDGILSAAARGLVLNETRRAVAAWSV